jgi:hypothetical protein
MRTTVGFKDQIRDNKGGPVLTEEQRKGTIAEVLAGSPDDSSPNSNPNTTVFGSVWAEVEEIAANLRSMLLERLEDHTIPLDEQEKTLSWVLCFLRLFGR